ncbi:hypothetical protein GCWU000341_02834 [Oribacterium sp. oral taxon 078 str. F0262]|nr:hypothetical protein GCWU000341_02834 [Oribacterium sp. oral taxon 078 str. F0262]
MKEEFRPCFPDRLENLSFCQREEEQSFFTARMRWTERSVSSFVIWKDRNEAIMVP